MAEKSTSTTPTATPPAKDAAGNTTGEVGITPEAFKGNAELAEKQQDQIAEIEEEHLFKGEQMTPEEYDRIGKGRDYDPKNAGPRVPSEDTLPQSTVRYPEGVERPDEATVRTHRTTSRSIKTEDKEG